MKWVPRRSQAPSKSGEVFTMRSLRFAMTQVPRRTESLWISNGATTRARKGFGESRLGALADATAEFRSSQLHRFGMSR